MKASGQVVMLGMPRRFISPGSLQAGGGVCPQCQETGEPCPGCERMGKDSSPMFVGQPFLNAPIIGNPITPGQRPAPAFVHPKFLNTPIVGNPDGKFPGIEGMPSLPALTSEMFPFTQLQVAQMLEARRRRQDKPPAPQPEPKPPPRPEPQANGLPKPKKLTAEAEKAIDDKREKFLSKRTTYDEATAARTATPQQLQDAVAAFGALTEEVVNALGLPKEWAEFVYDKDLTVEGRTTLLNQTIHLGPKSFGSAKELAAIILKESVVRQQQMAIGQGKGPGENIEVPDPQNPGQKTTRQVQTKANYWTLTKPELEAKGVRYDADKVTNPDHPVYKAQRARTALVELEGYDWMLEHAKNLAISEDDPIYKKYESGRLQWINELSEAAKGTAEKYIDDRTSWAKGGPRPSYGFSPGDDRPQDFKR